MDVLLAVIDGDEITICGEAELRRCNAGSDFDAAADVALAGGLGSGGGGAAPVYHVRLATPEECAFYNAGPAAN